jgi:hypothetical protein
MNEHFYPIKMQEENNTKVAGKVTCVWKVVGSRSREFECFAILFNEV